MNVNDFKHFLMSHTKKIGDSLNATLNEISNRFGITSMQLRILMCLYNEGNSTIGHLADCMNMAGANISTMCKKLEQKGLVSRNRDSQDERVVRITLTDQGIETVSEIDEIFNNKILLAISQESEESIKSIVDGLEKLTSLISKMDKQ